MTTAGPAAGQEDAGARALQQNQLQRQQQQEQLQLRLQQYQRGAQNPARDARQRQAVEQLEMDQSRRQQQLHQQQQRDLQTRPDLPFEDPGTRDAKAQIEQQRAARESRQQLQQFDRELQQQGEAAGAGSERRPLPAVPRQGSGGLTPPP